MKGFCSSHLKFLAAIYEFLLRFPNRFWIFLLFASFSSFSLFVCVASWFVTYITSGCAWGYLSAGLLACIVVFECVSTCWFASLFDDLRHSFFNRYTSSSLLILQIAVHCQWVFLFHNIFLNSYTEWKIRLFQIYISVKWSSNWFILMRGTSIFKHLVLPYKFKRPGC